MTSLKGMVIQSHLDRHLNVDLGLKSFLRIKPKAQVSLRVCGSKNRFTNLCRSVRGRQASYKRHMGETHHSIQCVKFHSVFTLG